MRALHMITYHVSGEAPQVISEKILKRIAKECSPFRNHSTRRTEIIGIRFVDQKEIRNLNRVYRNISRATDVLTFSSIEHTDGSFIEPSDSSLEHELGDLVLCLPVVSAQAKRRSISTEEELIRMIVHGTLHLFGMDHAILQEEKRMFAIQEAIVLNVMEQV